MSKEKKQNINAPWTFIDMIKSHAMFIDSKGKKVIINLDKMTQPNEQRKCQVDGQYSKDNNKDLHFYCAFCGEEMEFYQDRVCKTIPHKQTSMDWEKEFDERFLVSGGYLNHLEAGNLKSFIEKTLTQARREERERIVVLINKIHPYIDEGIYPDIDQTVIYNVYKTAFYRAKEDIAQKIKSNLHKTT